MLAGLLKTKTLTIRLRVGIRILVAVVCLVSLIWVAHPAFSQESGSLDELKQQQQQIDQQRSAVQKERDRVQKLEKSAQSNLKGIRKTIQVTAAQLQANEAKLQKATQRLKKLQIALDSADRTYRQKQSATGSRLRFLQRQQKSHGWAVLLQSQSLNDFLDRRYQLRRVYKTDRKILINLKSEADRLDRQQTQVEQQKNQIALITQELLAQKSESEAQATYQNQVVDRLKTDRRALEAAEAQLEKDSQGIGLLIQRRVAQERAKNGIVVLGTGQMSYPNDGEITSGFGWRMHPILGYQRFHSGVDFGADYGSTIRAADRGVVIFAGWYGGYGNAVIIDHGNNITTLYGHSSGLYVSEGQAIERGQPIAAVGSTGLSTGPHLHFEVRQNGEPVDPMAYF
ncbi:murein hydrolase activator EnvC family protein [Phormidesmis priestleyi]|uniref:murein hydrolase activator EnvC family protein n=1 Tax=Phormidesmis priestleyi TaxID=268141 RepID=UPI0009EF36E9|nr:M23 family metallopeptidase [Phormidesmis priestleyi]